MKYKLDLYGDSSRMVVTKEQLERIYEEDIEKSVSECGYPDFECWVHDMVWSGLLVALA